MRGIFVDSKPVFTFPSDTPASGVDLTLTLVNKTGAPVIENPTFHDVLINVVKPGVICPEGTGGKSSQMCCPMGTSTDVSQPCSGHGRCGTNPTDTSPLPGTCKCEHGWSGEACAFGTLGSVSIHFFFLRSVQCSRARLHDGKL